MNQSIGIIPERDEIRERSRQCVNRNEREQRESKNLMTSIVKNLQTNKTWIYLKKKKALSQKAHYDFLAE